MAGAVPWVITAGIYGKMGGHKYVRCRVSERRRSMTKKTREGFFRINGALEEQGAIGVRVGFWWGRPSQS